ncbi:hypothetical protein FRC10_007417 [Ceratobasidium sp. 414]|nr:hypothetical protein FRC10_007417 [Ceratobasidium sp. 414]
MVDARWFDMLDAILRSVRLNHRPFGGIQLVICGDFFQLPPVPDHPRDGEPEDVKFAFEAESWNKCVPTTIRLTKVFRQAQPEFVNLLNDLREGVVSPQSEGLLQLLSRKVRYRDGIQPTELFPHRFAADDANRKRLEQLKGEKIIFRAADTPGKDADGKDVSTEWAQPLLDRMAPLDLELAVSCTFGFNPLDRTFDLVQVGAQVMCTKVRLF